MRIHVNQITDILTFHRYFNDDGPTRSVDYFISHHTEEVASFKSSVVPVGGDPLLITVDGKLRELAIVMVAWDATGGEELEAHLLVIDPTEEDAEDPRKAGAAS